MAQTLEYNQAAVTAAALTVPSCDVYTENIRDLDDEPNDVGGLTAAELKATFDRTGEQLVDYINDELIPAIIAADATEDARAAAEAERVSNEQERVSNEAARAANEQTRASSEQARQAAEAARADETAGIVAEASQYKDRAERYAYEAASSRNQAQQYAVNAANSQNAAASSASAAASSESAAANSVSAAAGSENAAAASASAAAGSESAAANSASAAAGSASAALSSSTLAQSYAKGGTNTRTGEDTDNAKYYAEQAQDAAARVDLPLKRGTGTNALIEGSLTGDTANTASGDYSHAEGLGTSASSLEAHAEGGMTTASGDGSHAEGVGGTAQGYASHAEGHYTRATHRAQHVFGEFNDSDDSAAAPSSRGNYVEIVGNGADDNNRSNARTLDWNGNETLAGKLTLGAGPTGSMDAATKQYVDEKSVDLPLKRGEGTDSLIEGCLTGENENAAHGAYAHAEGLHTSAYGSSSHAEGHDTLAWNMASHAEGWECESWGWGSHAEGIGSNADGNFSHAEGNGTFASGNSSHAEGKGTKATRKSQHVFGEYNVPDDSGTATGLRGDYVEIVGNGADDNNRSNARTLDWNGNETLAGKLTLGAGPTGNMDAVPKQYVDEKANKALCVPVTLTAAGWADGTPDAETLGDVLQDDWWDANEQARLYLNTSSMNADLTKPDGSLLFSKSDTVRILMAAFNSAGEDSFTVQMVYDTEDGSYQLRDRSGNEISAETIAKFTFQVNMTQLTLPQLVAFCTAGAEGISAVAQTVAVTGVKADETAQLIQPVAAKASEGAYDDADVHAIAQAANSLTFAAETAPEKDLTVYICITELEVSA